VRGVHAVLSSADGRSHGPVRVRGSLRVDPRGTIVKTYSVGATSRLTVDVGMTFGLRNESFGTIVESTNGVPIVTERAMYWTPGSILFAGAIATTGSRLQ
jgi:hypothetical protein